MRSETPQGGPRPGLFTRRRMLIGGLAMGLGAGGALAAGGAGGRAAAASKPMVVVHKSPT